MIREQTLTERAQRQLEELIVAGKIKPGDRLPSESQMGKMLGVSRTVVREAVRLLSARGLVDVKTGSGIYVRELNSIMMSDPIDLLPAIARSKWRIVAQQDHAGENDKRLVAPCTA